MRCNDCYRPAGVNVVTIDGPINLCLTHFNERFSDKKGVSAARIRGDKIVGEYYHCRVLEIERELRRLRRKFEEKWKQ